MTIPFVEWAATFRDRAQHAHVGGWRFCRPNLKVMDVRHWRRIKAQPGDRCRRCQRELRRMRSMLEARGIR